MRQRKLIGLTTDPREIELDRSIIRQYASAIGAKNPQHFDLKAAKKAGLKDLLAPASLAAAFGQHLSLIDKFEVHPKNVLHSEETIELSRPLVAGDRFKVISAITDVQERPMGSSTTGFVTIEDRASDEKGKPLFRARRILAVRGGFPRR